MSAPGKFTIEKLREIAKEGLDEAIRMAHPNALISQKLRVKLRDGYFGNFSKFHVIGLGKASINMVEGAIEAIYYLDRVAPPLVITHEDSPRQRIKEEWGGRIITASHPVPNEKSVAAGKALLERVQSVPESDIILFCVSGGGSSLACLPAQGITLADKIKTTEILLKSNVDIKQMNCVRKHLSQIKGGWLAHHAQTKIQSFVLSDVYDDDLSSIASGLTVPDDTTFEDACEVVRQCGARKFPLAVREHLMKGRNGDIEDTPKNEFDHVMGHEIIWSNQTARMILESIIMRKMGVVEEKSSAYSNKAGKKGRYAMNDSYWVTHPITGEAREEAKKMVKMIRESNEFIPCIVTGGETTVTIKGKGKGGRNQEFALAFALEAEKQGLQGEWVFLSGATDGRDRLEGVGGGMVDNGSLERMRQAGIDPRKELDDNNSYHALKASGDLLEMDDTGTNVADIQILLRFP